MSPSLFLSYLLFTSYYCTSQCIWTPINNINGSIDSIYIRSNCNNFTHHQLLEMIFIEPNGQVSFPLQPPVHNTHTYGLNRSNQWSYVRVFARETKPCSPYGIYDKGTVLSKCFVTGSVDAQWVGSGAYYMSLVLAPDTPYEIYLYRGFDGCRLPLEELSYNDFMNCPDKSTTCTDYCTAPAMDPENSTLARFEFRTPPRTSQALTDSNIPCRQHSTRGLWSFSQWSSPFNCAETISRRQKLCIIGDSHMIRMLLHTKNSLISRIGNYVHNPNISVPLKGEKWHPKTESMVDSLKGCGNVVQLNGAIVWWYGSHSSMLSPEELAQTIRDSHSDNRHACTLIIGPPVSQFEYIPSQHGELKKYYQNPWRLRAQNDALKRAADSIPNYHFVDVYEETLALYFDGHYRNDPVHMSMKFYFYLLRLIIQTASRVCARK